MYRSNAILKWVICVSMAVFALVPAFVMIGTQEWLGLQDWASWAQAWGGIAGIAVAIWISREDIRLAARTRREDDEILDRSVRTIIAASLSLVDGIENRGIHDDLAMRSDPMHIDAIYKAFIERTAREIHSVLRSFPVERLAGLDLIESVIRVRRAMVEIAAQSKWFSLEKNGNLTEVTMQQFATIKSMVTEAVAMMPPRSAAR